MKATLCRLLLASTILVTIALPTRPAPAAARLQVADQPKVIALFTYQGTTLEWFGGTYGWSRGTINLELRLWQNTVFLGTWTKTCENDRACALPPMSREILQKGLTFTFFVMATRPSDGGLIGATTTKQVTT